MILVNYPADGLSFMVGRQRINIGKYEYRKRQCNKHATYKE